MDQVTLGLFGAFGAVILAGYAWLLYKAYKKSGFASRIWGSAKSPVLRKIYMVMIAASFVFGSYLVYFFTTSPGMKEILYPGLVLLLAASAFWAWFPFTLSKFVLAAVAIGALLLLVNSSLQLSSSPSNDPNKTNIIFAVVGCCILFVQTFFFDFMIWNGFAPRAITGQ